MNKPNVVLQSDFGIDSGLVSCMHGVCKQVDPTLGIYDISHVIRAFDIIEASTLLQYTVICWPKGTVFVSVVDPGVGTKRRPCVAKTKNGYYVVTPDNGTLTWLDVLYGIEEVREIDESINRYRGSEHVDIFHGRDLFAYTAARLASGIIDFSGVGPAYPVSEVVHHNLFDCTVEDRHVKGVAFGDEANCFGIMTTNIPNAAFQKSGFTFGDMVRVAIRLKDEMVFSGDALYGRTFGDVARGECILHPEIDTFMGFSMNMERFSARYHIQADQPYTIEITPA